MCVGVCVCVCLSMQGEKGGVFENVPKFGHWAGGEGTPMELSVGGRSLPHACIHRHTHPSLNAPQLHMHMPLNRAHQGMLMRKPGSRHGHRHKDGALAHPHIHTHTPTRGVMGGAD